MKKTINITFITLLCVLLCSCGSVSPKKSAQRDLKNYADSFSAAYSESLSDDEAESDKIAKALVKNFSYKIGKQSIDETTATVHVKITNTDMGQIMSDTAAKANDAVKNGEEFNAQEWMLDQMTAEDAPKTTIECDIPYVLRNGNWEIDETGDIQPLVNAVSGGLYYYILGITGTVGE